MQFVRTQSQLVFKYSQYIDDTRFTERKMDMNISSACVKELIPEPHDRDVRHSEIIIVLSAQ